MARSHKKFPGWKDNDKFFKNYSNRSIRRRKGYIPNGGAYKHFSGVNIWAICDWVDIYYSKRSLLAMIQRHLDDYEECYKNSWNKIQKDYHRRWIKTYQDMKYQAYMK